MNHKYNINIIDVIKASRETYPHNIKHIKLCLQAGWAFLLKKKKKPAIFLKGNGIFPLWSLFIQNQLY